MSDKAQLLVYEGFFNKKKKEFCEDLLGVTPLQISTRGHLHGHKGDVNEEWKRASTRGFNNHRWSTCHVCGKKDNPEFISYHCIIHQSVLCSTLSEDEYAEVMYTIMGSVNFLMASSSHQHPMLREFLREVDADADDLLLHNNVRWISCMPWMRMSDEKS